MFQPDSDTQYVSEEKRSRGIAALHGSANGINGPTGKSKASRTEDKMEKMKPGEQRHKTAIDSAAELKAESATFSTVQIVLLASLTAVGVSGLIQPASKVLQYVSEDSGRLLLLGYWVVVLVIGLPVMDWLSRSTDLQTILIRKVSSASSVF